MVMAAKVVVDQETLEFWEEPLGLCHINDKTLSIDFHITEYKPIYL